MTALGFEMLVGMWVEDAPGGGATIGFRLPLARATVEPAVPGRSP